MVGLSELNVNFSGAEMQTIFYEPTFMDAEVLADFRVIPNVTTKRRLGFIKKMERIVRANTGCGFSHAGRMDITDREIETSKAKINVGLCWEEFKNDVFEEFFQKGVNIADLTGTMIMDALLVRISEAVKLDNARLFFYGAKSSANPEYDATDGLFTVHVPNLIASGDITRVVAGNGAYAPGEATDLLDQVESGAKLPLKGLPNDMKRIYCDGLTYEAYIRDLEGSTNNNYGTKTLVEGIERVTFRNKLLVPQWNWNEIIDELGNPGGRQVLYTVPKNLVIATDVTTTDAQMRIYFDENSEEVRVKGNYRFGSQYVHHDLIQVGY